MKHYGDWLLYLNTCADQMTVMHRKRPAILLCKITFQTLRWVMKTDGTTFWGDRE